MLKLNLYLDITELWRNETGDVLLFKRSFVVRAKDDIFEDNPEDLMERLTKAADDIRDALSEAIVKLAENFSAISSY
ncbi:hypothetical protein BDQ12DRAFT_675260 [Crucibulum laeve]|uniref:Uncharacterized protein n=1 Tax=Crucibulum laeve TaxID=68775 RepID=A0A5C3MGU5_9AGAR|nr:hypothetical protein BDQ12DRAFT_675260 [Crucibulum laeve]